MSASLNKKGQAIARPTLRIAGNNSMPFTNHKQAALALLDQCQNLSHKEAGFLGNICILTVPTIPQRNWLAKLLERHGFPPLADGGVS
jgi:hypothetical protein